MARKINPENFPLVYMGESDYKKALLNLFYTLFMGMYEIEGEGISHEWKHYLFNRLWFNGTAAAFVPDLPKESKTKVWFAPFAATAWAGNDRPTFVQVINPRGLPGYPGTSPLPVANDQFPEGKVVICHALQTGLPVKNIFEFYISKMVELQEQIDQNNKQVVLPMAMPTDMDKEKFREMAERAIAEKWLYLPVEAESAAYMSPVATAGVYVSDKLIEQRKSWFNEAKALLGIDSGADEKRERLTSDEANANNALINLFREANQECMDAFAHNLEYLGIHIRFKARAEISESVHENKPEEGGKERKDDTSDDGKA